MFVSGLFMKNTVNNKKYDRMFSYLILGFATKMFKFIANCIVGRKLKIEYFNEDSIAWYAFAVFVAATAVLSYINFRKIDWLLKIFKGKYPYNKLPDYNDFGGLFRAGHYIVAFVFALIALIPKAGTFISKIGSRTLPIYALHTGVLSLLRGFGMDSFLVGILGENYLYAIPVVAILILLVTSIKPFGVMIDKIINPPLSAERMEE